MAYTKINLTNGVDVKTAPVGFSWTMFFFGGWPCIFRQHWLWGIGMIIASMLTYGIAGIVGAFFYNKVYIKSLVDKGYRVRTLPPNLTEEGLKNYLGYITVPMENQTKAGV